MKRPPASPAVGAGLAPARERITKPRSSRRDRTEDDLLRWLRTQLPDTAHKLGDDAATLWMRDEWAFTVDSQIEGTHFPSGLDPAVVARRLLAVNLSDLAAMGAAHNAFALLALSAPAGFDHRRFLRSFATAARRAAVFLIGGDLARAPVLVATLTMFSARPPRGHWLERGLGKPGDALHVGGTLGESALGRLLLARGATVRAPATAALTARQVTIPAALGLRGRDLEAAKAAVVRHLQPPTLAQRELAAALARRRRCAAMDVSDGLARDLSRLCAASGTGATIDAGALPLAPRAHELAAALGADARTLALGGGEDYVLLFALPPRAPAPPGALRIGTLDAEPGLRLRARDARGNEKVQPLAASGWDHLT